MVNSILNKKVGQRVTIKLFDCLLSTIPRRACYRQRLRTKIVAAWRWLPQPKSISTALKINLFDQLTTQNPCGTAQKPATDQPANPHPQCHNLRHVAPKMQTNDRVNRGPDLLGISSQPTKHIHIAIVCMASSSWTCG